MLHRGEAAALLVGHVGQGAHGFDRAVLDLHDGIDVAVAEMHTHTGFKATGKCGRDSESRRAHWIDSCWLKYWQTPLPQGGSAALSRCVSQFADTAPDGGERGRERRIRLGQRLAPDHGSRYRRIKGQCSHDGVALVVGKPGNGLYFLMVEVRLVDEDRDRDAEVVAQGRDALEVVTVAKLTAILRLANSLDRSHKQKMKGVKATLQDNELILKIDSQEDITLERGFFQTNTEFFKEVYSITPVIRQKKKF